MRADNQGWAVAIGAYACLAAFSRNFETPLLLAVPFVAIPLLCWTFRTPNRWLGLFFFSALLLPPLPFAIGNSGPHPAMALALFGLFVGAVRLADWKIAPTTLNATAVTYLAVLLTSVAFAALYSGVEIAAGSLARVVLFGISVYVFLFTAHGPESPVGQAPSPAPAAVQGDGPTAIRHARLLFLAGALSAAFACLDFYFQFPAPAGFGPQFVWLDSGVYRRAQGVFYEATTLGNLCSFFLTVIAVAIMWRARAFRFASIPALAAGAIVFSTALVLSYSRSSLINLMAGLGALLVLERRRLRLGRLAMRAGGAALACIVISYALFPKFADLYWLRLRMSMQYFTTSPGGVLSGRVESWRQLVQFLFDHPWHAIFGVGYKTLPYSGFTGGPVTADNMYLSMLVETGLVGFAALLLFNGALLREAYRAARDLDPTAAFFGTVVFCFWTGQMLQMFSVDLLTFWRVLPVYFWTLAIAIRSMRDHADANTIPRPVR